jgi:hypothetical protein
LVPKVKVGGKLRLYLYWKRHGISGAILSVVRIIRRGTTRLPFWLLKWLCFIGSAALYVAVVIPYRLLSFFGVRRHAVWPLFVYTRYPFRVFFNDQFDRFSAPLEGRYDADEVEAMLTRAGLQDVRVWPAFGWIAEGTRPPTVG